MNKPRYIVHIDMDAFFASVEQRDNPQYRLKPVIIGADPGSGKGRGVVSTCSYEARKFGVHSAMPISTAYRLCPKAVYLRPDMEKYSRVSDEIFTIIYDFTPVIQRVSIDEAFLDISDSYQLFGTAYEACRLMKSRIKEEAGLTASVGLAPTKMAAKIASDLKKPDGLVEVRVENMMEFLRPLDVGRISGVGEKAKALLNQIGVRTIGDLADKDIKDLAALFGKNGLWFWRIARGIDEDEVAAESRTRSISNEITFERDTRDDGMIKSRLSGLSEEVSARMRGEGFKCRTITLKVRLEGFQTFTRSITIAEPSNFTDVVFGNIKRLYDDFQGKDKKVRLVGVKASNLVPADEQTSLFKDKTDARKEKVESVVDKIRGKFGDGSICRAASKDAKKG
ncbi:MAG: DNA polymerase IV [Candidatus Omnitrophica bacterium]|nr:DNA polymerase IV [Candidatus Omnitrophota bacterium]